MSGDISLICGWSGMWVVTNIINAGKLNYIIGSYCFEIGVGCFFAKTEPKMLELFLS